jgi:multidrug efflux pump subunit AcrB
MKYMPTTINIVLVVSMFVALIFLPIVLSFLKFDNFNSKSSQGKKINSENKFFKKLE